MVLRALGLLALLAPAALPQVPAPAPASTPVTAPAPARARRTEPAGLRYVVTLHLRGEEKPWETRFTLLPTPPVSSHNRVKKPRLGGWRLEADRGQGTVNAHSFLLARAERMLFLSGAVPVAEPEPWVLRFGGQSCTVWRLQVPKGVRAAATLAEVGPGLLALCDLSARFDRGDILGVELHLEGIGLKPGTPPPEGGTALLTTLQRWAATGSAGEGPAGGGTEGVN